MNIFMQLNSHVLFSFVFVHLKLQEFVLKTNILAIWIWKSVSYTPYAAAWDDTAVAHSKFAMVPHHKLAISGVPIGPIPVSILCRGKNVLSVQSCKSKDCLIQN